MKQWPTPGILTFIGGEVRSLTDRELTAVVRAVFGRDPQDADEAAVFDGAKECLRGNHDRRQGATKCNRCGTKL